MVSPENYRVDLFRALVYIVNTTTDFSIAFFFLTWEKFTGHLSDELNHVLHEVIFKDFKYKQLILVVL